jgi:hypothetical protein
MARPKSAGPTRTSPIPVRYLPAERRYVEAARDKEFSERLRPLGISEYGLSEFVRAASFERAERVLGLTLEEFEAKERRRSPDK